MTQTIEDEISLLGRLQHPHLIKCLGATKHTGHFNIFLEWMPGERSSQVYLALPFVSWCQSAKKVLSDSLALVDFSVGLVHLIHHFPDGQVNFGHF